jgi:hypothetical protein
MMAAAEEEAASGDSEVVKGVVQDLLDEVFLGTPQVRMSQLVCG